MLKRSDLDRIKGLVRAKFERRSEVRLVCFGASVTAQTGDAGFCSHLREYLSRSLPGVTFELDRMAFGANHFDDAAFFNIDRIASKKPDICLLDWHSTGLAQFDEDRYVYVTDYLVRSEILPVHVFFPRKDGVGIERLNVLQSRFMEQTLGLPCIDLGELSESPEILDRYLRDGVHTNVEGARAFADRIAVGLEQIIRTGAEFGCRSDARLSRPIALDRAAAPPSILDFLKNPLIVDDNSSLMIAVSGQGDREIELYADLLIGPHAPIIASRAIYQTGSTDLGEKTIWDPSCFYSRISMCSLASPFRALDDRPFDICVDPTTKVPRYEDCRRAGFSFDGKRLLIVRRLMGAHCELSSARVVSPRDVDSYRGSEHRLI
jgi:hypothetical protein